jgi:hypothetical protein
MNLLFLLLWILPDGPRPAAPGDSLLVRGVATSFDVDLYGRIVLVEAPTGTAALFSADGVLERTMGGTGWGTDQFDSPAAVWMRNGIDIFVADFNNHRIQRFDRNLNFVSSLSTRDSPDAMERFGYPSDVALSRMGDLYICDTENSRLLKFDRSNRVDRVFGGLAAGKGRLHGPTQLEIGPSDRVYVLDVPRIQVFDSFGNFLRSLGDSTFGEETMLSADQDGLAVLRGSSVVFFDREDREAGILSLSDSTEAGPSPAKGLVVQGDDLYLLVKGGILPLRGARERALTK